MITLKNTANNVIAFEFSGTAEKSDIQKLEKVFAEKLTANTKLGLFMDMTKWSDITGDAIAEDWKFETGMLTKLNRFGRVAIVSDKRFFATLVNFMKQMVPTMDIKVFPGAQADKALTFASEGSVAKAA